MGADETGEDLVSGENNNCNGMTILTGCAESGSRVFSGDTVLLVRTAESAFDIEDREGNVPTGDIHGIKGLGHTRGAGVIGLGGDADGTGVIGCSGGAALPPLRDVEGCGVVGVSHGDSGVVGISRTESEAGGREIGAGVVGISDDVELGAIVGVFDHGDGVVGFTRFHAGVAGYAALSQLEPQSSGRPDLTEARTLVLDYAPGVAGVSGRSVGVYGLSLHDRGAVLQANPFSEKIVAQLRLVPQTQTTLVPHLPRSGKVGDLLMLRNSVTLVDTSQHETKIDNGSLWLCVPEQPAVDFTKQDSSLWREVVLGAAVVGTLP
jgi:hypothetical protein